MIKRHLLTITALFLTVVMVGGTAFAIIKPKLPVERIKSPEVKSDMIKNEQTVSKTLTPFPTIFKPEGPVVIPEGNNPTLGRADAPVYIVEYSDFQCPFCAKFDANYFGRVKREYIDTGKVRYVVKDFPLSGHDQATPAALVGQCVYQLAGAGSYFDYRSIVFTDQDNWPIANDPVAALITLAKQVGVKESKLQDCYESGGSLPNVNEDAAEADQIGLSGTPVFFFNGTMVAGYAPSYDAFKAEIEKALALTK